MRLVHLNVICRRCSAHFRVDSNTERNYYGLLEQIICPRCSRRYEYEAGSWVADRNLEIIA